MRHRWTWATALVGAIAATPADAGPPAADGGFGTIRGRLVWRGEEVPARRVLPPKGWSNKDAAACAADGPILDNSLVVDPRTRGVRYGIAYLARPVGEDPGAARALAEKPAQVRVKGCEFEPYVSAFHQDQVIKLRSLDPLAHNARVGAGRVPPINFMLTPGTGCEIKLRAQARAIPVECDIHAPWSNGWIMVFDHPFFAVTGEDGTFEIAGVPAGDQTLNLWHETRKLGVPGIIGGRQIRVDAGRVADIGDIALDEKP